MDENAVLITGMGALTPLGDSFEQIADNLLAGRSATRATIDQQGSRTFPCIGTAVDEMPVPPGFDAAECEGLSKLRHMGFFCAAEALRDAGLTQKTSGLRVGISLGLATEWYRIWETDWVKEDAEEFVPVLHEKPLVNLIQDRFDLAGPVATSGAACASANFAFAQARRWLQLGLVDICLAGSCEIVSPITRANFHNLRAVSRRLDDPEHASRPFDMDRDGFVMGEGAAIFVLEPAHAARKRRARVYAEMAGFGASSDASHMIIPSDDPRNAARSMNAALQSAGLNAADVGYVNAHATGTPVGDRAESRAINLVFGADTKSIPVSSTKSMTGHLVSAAAAVEAIACIAAIERSAVPPTINLDTPDPECDLFHVPHHAIERPVNVALSNSFGFGGSNTTLVLRKAA